MQEPEYLYWNRSSILPRTQKKRPQCFKLGSKSFEKFI